uniref:Uncharacterized protein n=1 Tax=Oryza rufipogon TaxID=4529 RepID=A0A0E0P564_ORYRU
MGLILSMDDPTRGELGGGTMAARPVRLWQQVPQIEVPLVSRSLGGRVGREGFPRSEAMAKCGGSWCSADGAEAWRRGEGMQGSARDAWFYLVDAAQHGDDGKSWWPLYFGGKRSDSDSESSNNTPTSSRRPQEVFIAFQETDEERRSAASNLNRRLNELRQRGCAAQDAILQTKLGERDVFTMPQNNKIAAKALLDNIQVPNDPAINTTIAQVRAMVEAATFQHAEVALTASIVGGSSSNRPSQQQHAGSKHIEASQAGSSRPSLRTSDLRDKIEARRRSPQRHE